MSIDSLLNNLPPGLWLLGGALLLPLARGWARTALAVLVSLWTLYAITQLPTGLGPGWQWYGYQFTPLLADQLARLLALALALTIAAAMLFCAARTPDRVLLPALWAGGAALGVILAGDFVSLFLAWQILILATALVIVAAGAASLRYLWLQCLASLLLLAAIMVHVHAGHGLNLNGLTPGSPAGLLLLAAMLINVAGWPLSSWLTDAQDSPEVGLILLPVLLIYSALYVLLRLFPGHEALPVIGFILTGYALVNAVLENDLRRLLLDAMVAQAGLTLVALGLGSELSLNAAVAWSVAQILYFGLLWLTAAAVIRQTGQYRLTRLGGLFASMPLTAAVASIGALAVLAVPLTSGYVTTIMLPTAALDLGRDGVWFLLVAASAAAVLHAGLRYPWLVFFRRAAAAPAAVSEVALPARLAMLGLAFLTLIIGMAPCALYRLLPYGATCAPYTAAQLLPWLQLLVFAVLTFALCAHLHAARPRTPVSGDWLCRRGLALLGPLAAATARTLVRGVQRSGFWLLARCRALAGAAGYRTAELNSRAVLALTAWLLLWLLAVVGLGVLAR
ncbi:multicomponent Na+:H+ antiporter subunit D [Methylohalomonas lacus]|uniref:Multicomponent Na+:H+ antiporter subunit D n=1 Tax=Methylohalomonas lacus TaxID=398773 RepID=A0AAE3HKJ8_9GAMM|nr:proton-conducting transporter membrane subunit [Methylohalomonas lacus]MCS3902928.1 multicomponent Na+:H+ antiporter subunit D [Methylohalomonas lacus]